jgi:oligosaccharide repeat unit polymerase
VGGVTEFIILIPFSGILMILSNTFRFRRLINPASIIIFWWCFWLWISNFGLTGFFIPSAKTQVMVLVMVSAVFLGSQLASAKQREATLVARINERILQNERYLFGLNILFAPIIGFLFFRALPALLSGNPVVYRSLAFSGNDELGSAFRDSYSLFLFHLLISPVIFFSLLAGLVLFFQKGRKRLLLVSLVLVSIEAIMMMGRFNFYYILVFIVLNYLFLSRREPPAPALPQTEKVHPPPVFHRSKIKILLAVALLLILLIFLSVYRGENYTGVFTTLKKISVDYHTVGFVLFDLELSNPFSRLNTRLSYGRSSLGGVDTLLSIILRRLDKTIIPIAGESGIYFDERRIVGEDREGNPITANAFYTILYSLYFDGRYLTVVLVPLLFGYFLTSQYLSWLKNGSLDNLILLILLIYLGIFSLFQSPVEGIKFWAALLLVVGMKKFSLAFAKTPDAEVR